jgi:hypothetical protein
MIPKEVTYRPVRVHCNHMPTTRFEYKIHLEEKWMSYEHSN